MKVVLSITIITIIKINYKHEKEYCIYIVQHTSSTTEIARFPYLSYNFLFDTHAPKVYFLCENKGWKVYIFLTVVH